MRHTMMIFGLTGLAVLASASDAFAQRRGYGYGGGWGNSPGISINLGRGGYNSPYGYYGGSGYSSLYQGGYGGYGYNSAPRYYYSTPSYYVNPAPYYSATTEIRPSYYVAPTPVQQGANMTVLVPAVDAQVWFENRATSQQGTERLFHSPPLEVNQTFTYTIRARWMENGQAVDRERRVNVQAGQSVTVNFRENSRENLPAPLPRLPIEIPRF